MHSLRGTFRTRNTHIVRAPRVVLLGREIHLLFGHLAWFPLEQGILCAFPIDIPSSSRKMYRLVFCPLRAVLFAGRTRNTLVVCALCAILLEREILLFFLHFTWCFKTKEYLCCVCTSRGIHLLFVKVKKERRKLFVNYFI